MTGGQEPRRGPATPTPRQDGASAWLIYRGTGTPHDGVRRLPPPPPWRTFDGGPLVSPTRDDDGAGSRRLGAAHRGWAYQPDDAIVEAVNAALYLRRPLLVTGKAGTGKSTLAYSVAHELQLGRVLHWPITSRSTLPRGLYRYDAIGRLQEASLARTAEADGRVPDIGRYVRLGPLGTALLPQAQPRVLLIDELDKSDIDLPGDLLNVFEEGQFEIEELARLPDDHPVAVLVDGSTDRVPVERGRVRCREFPVVIVTSNGEREFPPAFLRRCLRLDIRPPDRERLATIVEAQLGVEILDRNGALIDDFLVRREEGDLATDQLLSAIYLATSGAQEPEEGYRRLMDAVLRPLDTSGRG